MVAIAGLAGCSKSQSSDASAQRGGGSVDMPKLTQAFMNTTNEQIRNQLFEVDQGFRYRDYLRAIAGLDKLANNPDVTEEQKKVVAEVLEQMKKLAGAAPAPAK
jgi:hypothetical protein